MPTAQPAPSGVIVVRVWRQDDATVARVLTVRDAEHPVEQARYRSSVDEVCADVRRFFADFEGK
ncbi:MAG: hypothetical protein ACR2MO_16075 [Acidimicrobiales bacterium]